MFQGYTQQTVDFLWGLRLNNERSWFLPRKEEFLACVDAPTRELARELTGEMTRLYPRDGLVSKVSRIYRDARRLYGRRSTKGRSPVSSSRWPPTGTATAWAAGTPPP